jgi:hypothetical protein
MELSERQTQVLKRLFAAGFRPIAIPPYESALCLHREECAVVLSPIEGGTFRVLAPASFLVDGKFGVRVKHGDREVFVSKQKELEATPERVKKLEDFQTALNELLAETLHQ